MEEFLIVGKVSNTHGVKGELKIIPLTDDPNRYKDLKWAFLDKKTGLEKCEIENVRFFKDVVIVKIKGIDTMNDAEVLKGIYIKVDRANAVKLSEDQFFICDLIGCKVFDENENLLGELVEVLQTGSNDVYVVKGDKGEILIPALKSVVNEISIENKSIRVTIPEGLVDDEI